MNSKSLLFENSIININVKFNGKYVQTELSTLKSAFIVISHSGA